MLTINWKQIYEIDKQWILILYDISKNHYFIRNKIATITKKDNDNIIKIIKKYYVFDDSESKDSLKEEKIKQHKNREKVLT